LWTKSKGGNGARCAGKRRKEQRKKGYCRTKGNLKGLDLLKKKVAKKSQGQDKIELQAEKKCDL